MTPNQIERLKLLVAEKRWSNFDFLAHPEFKTIDAIWRMFDGLSSKEIDLALDLLDDYLIIKDYSNSARELMLRLRELAGDASLLVTPVVDYKSERTKSGQSIHYEMSNFTGLFAEKRIIFLDDPKSSKSQDHEGIHVSVDDFIGTGNQFIKMTESILADGKKKNISHVAAICIQESAKKYLEEQGYGVIALNVMRKGLDCLSCRRGVPREQILSEYDELEKKTSCPLKYSLGWDKAEALVTMKATPNNTLPIFWIEGKDKKWCAPFPRPKR